MARIFLTGASGSVGAAVARELVVRGHEVTALVRKSLPPMKGVRFFFGDLGKIRDAASEVLQAEAVIHCASPRSDDRARALREDIEGTANLLDMWQTGNFVFASSQTVYGIPQGILYEDAPLSAGGWYDIAKIANEQQVHMTEGSGRGAGVSLRLPLIFASGPRRRDRQFLPQLADALLAGKHFLFRDEKGLETYGSVFAGESDIAHALSDALGLKKSGPYNVAGGFCRWKDLLEMLGRSLGKMPHFMLRADAIAQDCEFRMPQSRSFYDCSRFESATGFRPRESLAEVIAKFVRAEGY